MGASIKKDPARPAATVALASVVLLAAWMGYTNGGYFTGQWTLAVLFTALLLLVMSVIGLLGGERRGGQHLWRTAAIGLFTAYALWTLASLYWSPNRGDAWQGAGFTLLYLLVFLVTIIFIAQGASRSWIFAAASLGPSIIAALTMLALAPQMEKMFRNGQLLGNVGYHNGEAAFLLAPFWLSVYLAGSRRVNPALRGLLLAGTILTISLSVLTQSRGAMVAMILSVPVFFVFSGQRLRGLLALAPVAVALLLTFPSLNAVYQAFVNQGDPAAALGRIVPTVWLAAAGAGLYGLSWGLIDRYWAPGVGVTRIVGGIVTVGVAVALVFGGLAVNERIGDPVVWSEQKWEAFKTNDNSGQEQSRYLSASGSGRYTLWQVAWDDFTSHPVLGVGTHNYEETYYQNREQSVGFVRQPHMLPLEVVAERGVVGGLLFFGFLAVCVAAGFWKRLKHLNKEGKAQVGAILAALGYWFVHSSAEWFWQMPAVTIPAMVYLGTLVAPWSPPGDATRSRWPVRLLGAGAAIMAIAVVAPLYLSNLYLVQSKTAPDPRTGLQAIEKAQRFNPLDPQLRQREAELALQAGERFRAVEAYQEAIRLNPKHYVPYALLATLYEKMGEPDKALPLFQKASDLNPLDPGLKREATKLSDRDRNT